MFGVKHNRRRASSPCFLCCSLKETPDHGMRMPQCFIDIDPSKANKEAPTAGIN